MQGVKEVILPKPGAKSTGWCIWVIDGREPSPTVVADGEGEGGTCSWRGREPAALRP